jgi:hypothetical protein
MHVNGLVGTPSEIICAGTYLLFCDKYEEQVVTVLNTHDSAFFHRVLYTGGGPGEVLPPLKLQITSEGAICAFQAQNGRLHEYTLNSLLGDAAPLPEAVYQFEDRPANLKKLANGFVGIGMYEDGRYHLYGKNSEAPRPAGTYPHRGESMDPAGRFFLYQGALCASPDGTHFVMATAYCDNLEFFRTDGSGITPVRKYETRDVDGQYTERGIVLGDNCVMAYKGACGTDRYAFLLYSGERFGEHHARSTGGKTILMFDWEGNHIKTFEADRTIFSFCTDSDAQTLYAITYENENVFSVTRFNLE